MNRLSIFVVVLLLVGAGCSSYVETDTRPESTTSYSETKETSPVEENRADTEVSTDTATADTTFTLADVSKHGSKDDCYTTVRGEVYDVTSWVSKHPGGEKAILSICGKDGTALFEKKHDGQPRPENELSTFKIGTLVQ